MAIIHLPTSRGIQARGVNTQCDTSQQAARHPSVGTLDDPSRLQRRATVAAEQPGYELANAMSAYVMRLAPDRAPAGS